MKLALFLINLALDKLYYSSLVEFVSIQLPAGVTSTDT